MTKMYLPLLFTAMLFWAPTHTMIAQKAIYGNKKITESKRKVTNFHQVNVGINGKVIIHSSEQPHVIVRTDENLQEYISTKVNSGILSINQLKWPEPSKKFVVHVYAPMVTKIESDSWADITMENIQQDRLTLNLALGSIVASGSVDQLFVDSKQADFALSKLTTEQANVTLTGYAKMELCCTENLVSDISELARFQLNDRENTEKPARKKAVYIDFSIRNNQLFRNHFVVRGPSSHPFSYGFSMLPFTSKKERWPIGTRIFQESLSGKETLLVEITAKDAGNTVDLIQ